MTKWTFKDRSEEFILDMLDAIPKDVLLKRIDKLFTFMGNDVSNKKLTISKQQLIKDFLNSEEET